MNSTAKYTAPRAFWKQPSTILLAIGNNGREDDGLGWAFSEWLEQHGRFAGEIEWRYQLQIEDAELISHYDRVIFVDASKEQLPGGFAWWPEKPANEVAFSTHALSPGTVLRLAADIYGARPEAWTLAISGECWELRIGLSEQGTANLARVKENLLAASTG
jgi:hydrogenase maturation protease